MHTSKTVGFPCCFASDVQLNEYSCRYSKGLSLLLRYDIQLNRYCWKYSKLLCRERRGMPFNTVSSAVPTILSTPSSTASFLNMLKRRASADSHNATQTTPKPPTKKHKKQSVNADKPNIEDKHANQDYQTMFKRELPELERRRDARVAELRNSTKFVATARVYGVYVLKPENLTNPTIPYTAGYLDCPSTVVWWKRFYDKDTEVYQILNGLREESQVSRFAGFVCGSLPPSLGNPHGNS